MGVKNVRLRLLFRREDRPIVAGGHRAPRLPHLVRLDIWRDAVGEGPRVADVFESVESWSALTRG